MGEGTVQVGACLLCQAYELHTHTHTHTHMHTHVALLHLLVCVLHTCMIGCDSTCRLGGDLTPQQTSIVSHLHILFLTSVLVTFLVHPVI